MLQSALPRGLDDVSETVPSLNTLKSSQTAFRGDESEVFVTNFKNQLQAHPHAGAESSSRRLHTFSGRLRRFRGNARGLKGRVPPF